LSETHRIGKLDLHDRHQVQHLLVIQRAASTIEAELIGSSAIPALTESREALQQCEETFYGSWIDDHLAGAISYKREGTVLDIHRLVVHPANFRRGIGQALVRMVEQVEDGITIIVVSTGAKNMPAKRLYWQLGCIEKGNKEVVPGLVITQFEKQLT
jgi:ribosomal protein S18 acetylase RimI-like enzyme